MPSVEGVGGESAFINTHLLDNDGHVRDLGEVAKEIGDVAINLAHTFPFSNE